MTDIVTERSGSILRVQFNRPSKKNAMTSAMYITMADLLNAAAKDDRVRVVLCTAQETPSALATTWRISSRIPWDRATVRNPA